MICLRCLLRRPTFALKPVAIGMMKTTKIPVDVVQFLHACLDCQSKFLHDRRGIIVVERLRDPVQRERKVSDTLQGPFHAAGAAECVFLRCGTNAISLSHGLYLWFG